MENINWDNWEENLKKSVATDIFKYNVVVATKSGKEIKEKLQEKVKKFQEDFNILLIESKLLLESIGEAPTKPAYLNPIIKDKVLVHPMIFKIKYSDLETDGLEPSEVVAPDEPVKGNNSSVGMKEKYNQLISKKLNMVEELITLKSLMDNLQDNKKVELTLSQLMKLGY